MKKRALALLLAALTVASALTGCSGGTAAKTTPTPAPTQVAQEEKKPVRMEEMWLQSGDNKIFGTMYLPGEEKDRYPAVILSHGFNSNSDLLEGYAKSFAEAGYAAYAFDYCGGGLGTRSEGATTEMSVLTEAQNLMDVMDQIKALDNVDANQLFLFGQSQGGYVSAYTAAQRPEEVKALILFFPAFALQDDCWNRHGSIENVPDEEVVMGVTLSSRYSKDAMSFDIYEVIGNYKGDVLICHGDKDTLVDLSYSEKAVEVYDHAELKVIKYGEHGFQGKTAKEATGYALEFLQAHTN